MRTVNRVLAAVAGLVLLVGGLLAAIEIAVAYVGGGPWILPYDAWYRHARSNAWDRGGVRGLLIAITAVGMVILAMQLVRRRPLTLSMRSDTDATYAVRRHSLERSLVRTAERVDGVESARAKIDRRRLRIKARSNRRLPGDVQAALEGAMSGRLAALELESALPVRISLRLREGHS